MDEGAWDDIAEGGTVGGSPPVGVVVDTVVGGSPPVGVVVDTVVGEHRLPVEAWVCRLVGGRWGSAQAARTGRVGDVVVDVGTALEGMVWQVVGGHNKEAWVWEPCTVECRRVGAEGQAWRMSADREAEPVEYRAVEEQV